MAQQFPYKLAIVLSGGGAKGSMQFGMLKYLCEQGIKPHAIYGTSVGSLNSAGYAFHGIEGLQKVWDSIKSRNSVFKFNFKSLLLLSSGLFNARPLRKLLEENNKGTPQCNAYACKVNIETGDIKYTHCLDPDYTDSCVASASIPALIEDVDGWVDGGVREQTPLKQAILDGATKIIVILCNPLEKNPEVAKKSNWVKNLLRTTDLLAHEVFLNDIQSCLYYNKTRIDGKREVQIDVYAPEKLVIDSLDFNQEKIQPAIAYGYEQAKRGPLSNDYIEKL